MCAYVCVCVHACAPEYAHSWDQSLLCTSRKLWHGSWHVRDSCFMFLLLSALTRFYRIHRDICDAHSLDSKQHGSEMGCLFGLKGRRRHLAVYEMVFWRQVLKEETILGRGRRLWPLSYSSCTFLSPHPPNALTPLGWRLKQCSKWCCLENTSKTIS